MNATNQDARLLASMREVYAQVAQAVESFETDDLVGPDLAYLLGSMLQDTTCFWPSHRPLLHILRSSFPPDHPVWHHVQIEGQES
jgi:hypothetical protein